jgi:hypothetical protein
MACMGMLLLLMLLLQVTIQIWTKEKYGKYEYATVVVTGMSLLVHQSLRISKRQNLTQEIKAAAIVNLT